MSMQFGPPIGFGGQFGSRGFAADQSASASAAAHAHALAAAMAAVAQQQQQPAGSGSGGGGNGQHYLRSEQVGAASFGAEPISAHLLASNDHMQPPNAAEAADAAAVAAAFGQVPSHASDSSADYGRESGAPSGHLEQSQSGEVVDKIERHISHQIDQALGSSQYGEAQKSSAPSNEKDSSSSGSESSSAMSEGVSGGAEEAGASGGGGDAAEKRSHEGAEAKHHEEHHSHHEEHPPEAFEVHHKKGGKSFQYFHQGHHH